VEALLRKYLWALDLVVVGLCAIFLARAASSYVESNYLVGVQAPRPAPRISRPAATVYTKQTEEILKRNIFCSTCPPLIGGPEPENTGVVDTTPQKTGLPIGLMAVMYAPPPNGLKWSVAIIRDTEDKGIGAFGVGSKVRNATVTEILETRVYFDNAGRTEYLDLLDTATPTASAPSYSPPVATAPSTPSSDPLSQEMAQGIKKTGEHTYEIQRKTLEAVLGNMNALSRSARIVPEIRDGKAAGFRLYSVRPDGPFAQIGMQNGDVINAINGLDLTSPEKALEVYSKLKSASHLSVGVERNGQKVTKDYSIR
jgi:general secretion pathway protein C